MTDDLIVILCTAPDEATAEKLGRGLVEQRLAACVNAISGVKSFYRWQGKIEADDEIQLIIKTQPTRFDEVAAWINDRRGHSNLSGQMVDDLCVARHFQ